jgi:hypothetical protein
VSSDAFPASRGGASDDAAGFDCADITAGRERTGAHRLRQGAGTGLASQVIADAENKVRDRLGDPAAQFDRVQVTGDQYSGQACGYVTANPPAAASGGTGRFIVYIDGNPGYPAIEHSVGISTTSQAQFDFWWAHDCVGEGYKS